MTLPHGAHTILVLVACGVGAIAGFVFLNRDNPELEAWLASGRAEVATHGKFLKQIDSLKAVTAVTIKAARKLAQDTTALRQQRDSAQRTAMRLADALDSAQRATMQRAILAMGEACRVEVANCEGRSIKWENAATENAARAALATARATKADSVVKGGLKVVECHLLDAGPIHLFGCPSRKASFELGGVLGAIITWVIVHRN